MPETMKSVSEYAGKYLTFQLSGEVYGLEILKVQEIMGLMPVTHVPRTPDFIRGVINLRGKVIPVIDLRLKFGLIGKDDTEKTCIIVVQVRHEQGSLTIGVIVDEVCEVIDLKGEQIEAAPSFGVGVNTEFILGMGKLGQKVLTMLDIDKVLASGELNLLETTAA